MARSDQPRESAEPGPGAFVLDRRGLRDVDRLASERYGIPSILLMENAGLHLAQVVLEQPRAEKILIVCGPGNNGGDGLCAARHLHNAGADVAIVLSTDAARGDAAVHLAIARRMGLSIAVADPAAPRAALDRAARELSPDVVIDALLGTGLDRPVQDPLLTLIRAINDLGRAGAAVIAADLPSGLDCDTGEPLGLAVRATTTVSFVGLKAGFLRLAAQEYLGDVVVADIGAPRELIAELGRPLSDHEDHDGPQARPGHDPGPPAQPERPGP